MEDKNIQALLSKLADATAETVRPDLAEQIKHQIPPRLAHHWGAWHRFSILIDLRISRLAAAAVIIITTVILANFLGGRNSTGNGMYQDSKLLIKFILDGENTGRGEVLAGMANFYDHLAREGKDVTYYSNKIDSEDKYAVLIHWKLPDGKYRVIFGDLRPGTVSSEVLIILQARMLQKKAK